MKISKIITMLCGVFCITAVSAQVTKTFHGELGEGKMSYAYYEETGTGNEVRHGAFKYTEHKSFDVTTYSATFTGNYKDGYRDGVWSYLVTMKDNPKGKVYQTGTISMAITYKEGVPNGTWNYSDNFKSRRKLYSSAGWSWSSFESLKPTVIAINFKDGKLCGSLKFLTPFHDVTGQLNDCGLWVGKWIVKSGGGDQIDFNVTDGIVSSGVVRQKGVIEFRTNYDAELLRFHAQCHTMSETELDVFCGEHNLNLMILPTSKQFKIDDGYFENSIFKHKEIGGDKFYVSDEYGNFTDKKNYGKYIMIEQNK